MVKARKSKIVSATKPTSQIPQRNLSSKVGSVPVVGIGASAGGLDAFSRLLSHLPVNTGMAFVLLQHLHPDHESMSAEILSRTTKMSVVEVKNGTPVQSNCVYIIPPGFSMEILNGVLNLKPRPHGHEPHLVINTFFKSLASDQQNLGIGIVLSGSGADGTLGLKAIKASGGITFAQIPKSAKFANMPQSAIASGSVDLVLTPEDIARELARIARHPYVSLMNNSSDEAAEELVESTPLNPEDSLGQIFLLLRKHCHMDFSLYKSNTVRRRIERRMVLLKVDGLKGYAEFLVENTAEVKALYADILIHVTEFFRDPAAFEALTTQLFPKLMENRSPGVPIRIWVPGCSTGEEVYSIAICLIEFLGEKASHFPIQLFGSDISEQAIQKARLAEYSESFVENVSDERLNQFFIKLDGGGYKIAKSIRDICVFSRHDVTTDPPFARIDLISCRNLLIYFKPALQKHVIPIFHYALQSHGFLWLGKSESIGSSSDLFLPIDKGNKLFSRKEAPIALNRRFPSNTYVQGIQEIAPLPKAFAKVPLDVQKIADLTFQNEYPGVLVNGDMEILQIRGRTAPFVELVPGSPSFHLLKMARPELLRFLRTSIREAEKSKGSVRKENLSIGDGRGLKTFNLNVIPIKNPQHQKEWLYLILFEKSQKPHSKKTKSLAVSAKKSSQLVGGKDSYTLKLEQELIDLQEYQRALAENV